ncbi:MAG: hypothetical protein HYU33_04170 [Candidatus Omnitrophica bacterium]|nr:hypothetical protein [Candidatus Omnitrophota bacterium]
MKTIRPEFKIKIDIRPPFIDERGEILNLIDAPFASAAVIRSVKGAIRGNHYHKTDYHYCWLQSGGMVYYHRPVGGSGPIEKRVISAGELFYRCILLKTPCFSSLLEITATCPITKRIRSGCRPLQK